VIERALYICESSQITRKDIIELLPQPHTTKRMEKTAEPKTEETAEIVLPEASNLADQIEILEKQKIIQTLEKNRWNKSKTARDLGYSRKKLLLRLKKFDIE